MTVSLPPARKAGQPNIGAAPIKPFLPLTMMYSVSVYGLLPKRSGNLHSEDCRFFVFSPFSQITVLGEVQKTIDFAETRFLSSFCSQNILCRRKGTVAGTSPLISHDWQPASHRRQNGEVKTEYSSAIPSTTRSTPVTIKTHATVPP